MMQTQDTYRSRQVTEREGKKTPQKQLSLKVCQVEPRNWLEQVMSKKYFKNTVTEKKQEIYPRAT